jgi:hypothetical protein
MKPVRLLVLVTLATGLGGCLLDTAEPDNSFIADYQFGVGQNASGWTSGVVDFRLEDETSVGFLSDVRPLPDEVLDSSPSLYLEATNISADLFMYWFRPVEGLLPNTEYTIGVDLEYLTNYGRDCTSGAGPVSWFKAGVIGAEPLRTVDPTGWYRLNVDKGNLAIGGATIPTLGDLRNNSVGCIPNGPYALWARHSGQDAFRVRTDTAGRLWLIFGVESSAPLEPLRVYFSRFGVRFRPTE